MATADLRIGETHVLQRDPGLAARASLKRNVTRLPSPATAERHVKTRRV